MNMDISPIAINLIEAINEYIKESGKIDYRFTIDEQYKLQREITILQNHIDALIEYEIKKSDKINKVEEK